MASPGSASRGRARQARYGASWHVMVRLVKAGLGLAGAVLAASTEIGFTALEQFTLPGNGRRWTMLNLDARIPAHLAAAMVGVSRQLVNYWRRSGRLKPIAEASGRPLYRLGDVLAAERATRRSAQSHRKPLEAA